MKPSFIAVFIWLFAGHCYSCPTGCVCSSNACDSCSPGYFDGDSSAGVTCLMCPNGCTQCALNSDSAQLECSACDTANGWQLDVENKCFRCDSRCESCSEKPDNCDACELPFVHVGDDSGLTLGKCEIDEYCYPQCAACNGSDFVKQAIAAGYKLNQTMIELLVYCQDCMPGTFLGIRGCYSCPFGCSECSVDQDAVWNNQIVPFWEDMMQQIYTSIDGSQERLLPFVPDQMTSFQVNQWALGYFLLKYIMEIVPDGDAVTLAYTGLINFNKYLPEVTIPDDSWPDIAKFIKAVSGVQKTPDEVKKGIVKLYQAQVTCTGCQDGSYIDSANGICLSCGVNCATCDQSGCLTCKTGYFLDSTTCTQCDASCLSCSAAGASSCQSCLLPLTLSPDNTCVQCSEPCKTCTSTLNSCILCKKPYSLTAVGGACHQCDDRRCLDCDQADPTNCFKCLDGFILVDGACKGCPQNCLECSSGSTQTPSVCFRCREGYTKDSSGKCSKCSRGCVSCDQAGPGACDQCRPGSYLDIDSQSCLLCQQGCQICQNNICTKLSSGFTSYSGEIIACDRGCKACSSSNPRICFQCQNKFWLDSQVCRTCPSGCNKCTDSSTCTECRPGTLENSGLCYACGEGCIECTDASTCTKCLRGYVNNGGSCQKSCADGCANCDESDPLVCLDCKPGYSLTSANTCNKCSRRCSGSCDPENITACTSCSVGYQLIQDDCVKCADYCTSCLGDNCLSCLPGYSLSTITAGKTEKDICIIKCSLPCANCTQKECQSCIDGYQLKNGKCTLVTANLCFSECEYCPFGTGLSSEGICIPCPQQCSVCKNMQCIVCKDGYYLDKQTAPSNPTCAECPSQCKTCFDGMTCDICANGYFKELISSGQSLEEAVFSDQCSPCDKNCKTCFMEATKCQSCSRHFALKGNTCVSRYEVKISVLFDIVYSDFLNNQKGQAFLQAISEFLNKSTSEIDVLSLKEGSTLMTASVATSGYSNANSISQKLSDSDGMLASVGTVLSSSVGVTYDGQTLEEPEKKKVNRRLIIGLVFGLLGFIIICGLGCYFIFQRWSRPSPPPRKANIPASNQVIVEG